MPNTFEVGFRAFLALNCVITLGPVLAFSDAMVFRIAVPNIVGLYLFASEVKGDLARYLTDISSGAIPVYRG